MLRITIIESAPPTKTLRMEGRIAGTFVDELRRLCRQLLGPGASVDSAGPLSVGSLRLRSDALLGAPSVNSPLILDLSGVSFIDADGLELMRDLSRHNVMIINYSPFLAELLREVVPCS